jgi:hypothetical protein
MNLRVLDGGARAPQAFSPPAVVLDERSQRPGELADVVVVRIGGSLAKEAWLSGRRARLPFALYAVLAVEAVRAAGEVADEAGIPFTRIVDALDAASAVTFPTEFEPPPARPLRAYARALVSGGCHSTAEPTGEADLVVDLVVPDRLRARWTLAAQHSGITLNRWIEGRLSEAPAGVERWEAAAAAAGRTLAEWVSLQAMRRLR